MARDMRPSEFGGVPGRIQPDPHTPTNQETLSQIYSTEPAPFLNGQPDDSDYIPPTTRMR